jgi:dTDP-4-dehydrorhamnose 3,5-epimerase-like enzyme
MKGIEIIGLEVVKENDKGIVFEFLNRQCPKMLLLKRKEGTISGGHYHTGKNKLKDPETILFIDGKAKFRFKDVKTGEILEKIFDEPVMVKISPFIRHEIVALTDITFIDMNSIQDDNDTIKG